MESVRLKPIVFCGENPVMELYVEGTETLAAAASFWHSSYSVHGEGHALLLYLNDANASALGQPNVAIYSDNEPLARYLTDTFNQHFDDWKDLGFNAAPIYDSRFYHARFFEEEGKGKFYRVACHTQKLRIEASWTDIRSSDFRTFPDLNGGGFGSAGDEHYHVSNAIFLCGQGSININQQPVTGHAYTKTMPDDRFTSSVFVALSETWVKIEAATPKVQG